MSIAEILSLVSWICYILAGVCLILVIVFWFVFRIPSVIGDLSGRTARKSIARMRAGNEKAGGQGYKPSTANAARGKLTATMQHAHKLKAESEKKQTVFDDGMLATGVLQENKAEQLEQDPTDLLSGTKETALPADQNTTALLTDEPTRGARRVGGKKLTMIDEVIWIHTDEVI